LAATEMTLLGTKKQNQKYKAPKKMITSRVDREMKVLAAMERERDIINERGCVVFGYVHCQSCKNNNPQYIYRKVHAADRPFHFANLKCG
jgi:hypothetical protein